MAKRKKLSDVDMAQLEKEAVRQAAWGMYASQLRLQNFARDTQALQDDLVRATRAGNAAKKKAAQEKLGKFLSAARSDTTLVIGGGAGPHHGESDDF